MKQFNHCIWLTTSKPNIYKKYTNGFQLHMTIKYNVQELEAYEFIKKYNNKKLKYLIELSDELYYSEEKDFYCLYKTVKNRNNLFFDDNSHVSFYYSYEPIKQDIINFYKNKININKVIFDILEVKLCNGHFTDWK